MDSGLQTQYTVFGYRTQNKSDLVRNLLKSKEKSFKKRYGLSDLDYNIIMKSVEILKSERSKPRATFICLISKVFFGNGLPLEMRGRLIKSYFLRITSKEAFIDRSEQLFERVFEIDRHLYELSYIRTL